MSVTIRLEGLEELDRMLARVQSLAGFKRGIAAAAHHVKAKIAMYPPVRRGPLPGGFVSDRQRRKVFAMIREGEIPYRRGQSGRSENLAQKWAVTSEDDGLTGVAGTNVSYAPLVQDAEQQAQYHRITGWRTIQKVGEVETEAVGRIVLAEVERDLEG